MILIYTTGASSNWQVLGHEQFFPLISHPTIFLCPLSHHQGARSHQQPCYIYTEYKCILIYPLHSSLYRSKFSWPVFSFFQHRQLLLRQSPSMQQTSLTSTVLVSTSVLLPCLVMTTILPTSMLYWSKPMSTIVLSTVKLCQSRLFS